LYHAEELKQKCEHPGGLGYDGDRTAGGSGGLAAAACAAVVAAASPMGLFSIFSNMNLFRAEIGRVWRISTVSSIRSSADTKVQLLEERLSMSRQTIILVVCQYFCAPF